MGLRAKGQWVWIGWAAAPLLGVACAAGALQVIQPSLVRGASMRPTLEDGDRILVERITPAFGSLVKNDIVVLAPPGLDHERYVKRIVALPGDVVELHAGEIRVDGRTIAYSESDGERRERWFVPPDCCFVLGDSTSRSSDSRDFGPVPFSRVIGKVCGR